jgi:hypothetical protein
MSKHSRTVAGHIVELVSLTERRRLLVVVGVPVLLVALFELTANFGVLVVLLAAGLATFLYTRTTAQRTLAASAYGTGVVVSGLFVLELYLNGAQGSTEPLIGAATRVIWWAVAGTLLIALGLWLRQIDL